MRVVFFTNEYPPYIYGGAGVHVDYLTRELAKLTDVEIRCFGDQDGNAGRIRVKGHKEIKLECSDPRFSKAVDALSRNVEMAAGLKEPSIVHCHTWYSHFAGLLAKQLYQIPMVLTTHSLEPSRPWKVEQLGNAYHLSGWVERMAITQCDGVIAVSNQMKKDTVRYFGIPAEKVTVIYNGIDLDEYRPIPSKTALERYKIDPDIPYVLFVGRITRQKGIIHLVRAAKDIDKNAAVVLCAGAPDTPEISIEMRRAVEEAKKVHSNIIWIEEMVPKKDVVELYTHAAVFCCPSVYEPFGIINLEAMACETPVVASKVGGIPEIIVEGETGYLVDVDAISKDNSEPKDPERFSKGLAEKIDLLLKDENKRKSFAKAGRRRVEEVFSWSAIAKQTFEYYKNIVKKEEARCNQ